MLKNGHISVHWKTIYSLTPGSQAGAEKPDEKHNPNLDHVVLLPQIMHAQYRKTLLLDEGAHRGPHRYPATVTH